MNDRENYRNEIIAYIVWADMAMNEVVELANVLGYDIVCQKRRK